MRRKQFTAVISFLSTVTMLVLIHSLPVLAITGEGPVDTSTNVSNIEDQKASDRIGPMTYGTSDTIILQIPAASFQKCQGSAVMQEHGNAYVSVTTDGRSFAAVNLPNGAQIRWLDVYYYDNDAAEDITAYLYEFSGTSSPDFILLDSVESTETPGYGYAASFLDPLWTVDNDNQYLVYANTGGSTNVRFKAVDIWYRLQVSPAPATATFSDVPTSHQYFQFIEALADSGITTGYPDGTFRPGSYVTRGQMATFLSRALGLHWPY